MRPAITRAPGDAEKNCPTYAFLSAPNSTPTAVGYGENEYGVSSVELAKEYGISYFLLLHFLRAEKVACSKGMGGTLYDEDHAEEIAARIFAMGKLVSLREIRWRTQKSLGTIKSFFESRNIHPLITIKDSYWYSIEALETFRAHLREEARHSLARIQHERSAESRKRYAEMLAAAAPSGYIILAEASVKYGKTVSALEKYIEGGYVSCVKRNNRRYLNMAEVEARIKSIHDNRAEVMRANLVSRKRPAHDCPEGYVFMADYCKQNGLNKSRINKAISAGHIHSVKRSVYVYVKPEDVQAYLAKMEAKKCGKIERLSLLA